MKEMDGHHLRELFYGKYAFMFWAVQLCGLILPIILLLFKQMRKPLPAFIISIFVLIGAFFKRYIIVVPTLQHPYLPIQNVPEHFHTYVPTGIEIMITAASIAAALLIITFLAKMFPVMSVWELAEEKGVKREDLLD
jgi:Ni/Fe-hydrogenase subunit HybB-like protein